MDRARSPRDELRHAFNSALDDSDALEYFKTTAESDPDLTSQFKPLFLRIASARMTEDEDKKTADALVTYLKTLPGPEGGSRLNVKRRRTKRYRRSRKHRKLRKLTTRRR